MNDVQLPMECVEPLRVGPAAGEARLVRTQAQDDRPNTVSEGLPDAQLVRQMRGGSRDAAAELFQRHWPTAWRAAFALTGRRAMADDVAQDAFERAFAAIDRFDERRPFAPWLHRIVVNRAVDLIRAERRLVGLDAVAEFETWDENPGEDGPVLRAVAALRPERRAVVVLRHLLDYAPPEIAAALGLPVGTVNSRLGRAMAELRDALEGSDV